MLAFGSVWAFSLLLAIPLLHRLWKRRNQPPRLRFPLPIPKNLKRFSPVTSLLILRYFIFALLVFALARPQTVFKTLERSVQGIDIMLVLDVSASMNIEDLAEESRFDIAKRTIRSFVQGRTNDRIGFSVFSGEGVTLAPPTLDYGIVLQAISDAKIGELKDGTAIGDGLAVAVARLRNSDAKSKIIILLTDGDSNIGQVDPLTAGELAAGFGLKVYTIAIGKEGRVRMPIRAQNIFGKTVTTYQWFDNALNTELLQKIAESTQGKFYRVSDSSTLDAVYKEIDRLERTEVKANEKVRTEENFEKPLIWALVLLLLERILSLWVWRVIP